MKTNELSGAALDWAVAKCEGKNGVLHDDGITRCIVIAAASGVYKGTWKPTVNWSQGGPIIERESLSLECWRQGADENTAWAATRYDQPAISESYGPTPLIAAMRCYVASVLGDEVEIPATLLETV